MQRRVWGKRRTGDTGAGGGRQRVKGADGTCSGCGAYADGSTPLTLDSGDKRFYCSQCWMAYYGQLPPEPLGDFSASRRDDWSGIVEIGAGSLGEGALPPSKVEPTLHAFDACAEITDVVTPNEPSVQERGDDVAAMEHMSPDAVAARFEAVVARLRASEAEGGCSRCPEANQQQAEELEALGEIYVDALHRPPDSGADLPRTFSLELPIGGEGGVVNDVADTAAGVEVWVDTSDGKILAGTVVTLPPLLLLCALPSNYPLSGQPVPIIHAEHLGAADIAAVEDELIQLAAERPGEQVLFEWASLLQERVAAVPSTIDASMQTALQLLAADQRARDERRRRELHGCPVCFEDVHGSRGVFLSCGHFGCSRCFRQMAEIHTGEADIGALRCPVSGCREPFGPEALRELLGADSLALARWEELSLQRCLDTMQDIAYCPRCDLESSCERVPCIQDSDGTSQCGACGYAFCGRCRDAYHPGQPCASRDDKMEVLERRAAGRGPEAKAAQAELLTLRHVARTTKPCPTCGAAIEKSEGCSKMHCRGCGSYFCWRCGKTIQGYDHFATGACRLFDDEEVRRWNRQTQHVLRADARAHEARFLAQFVDHAAMRDELRQCPQCKTWVVRESNNNHMRCHGCQSHFCAKCGQSLQKRGLGEHFQRGGCPQHSSD